MSKRLKTNTFNLNEDEISQFLAYVIVKNVKPEATNTIHLIIQEFVSSQGIASMLKVKNRLEITELEYTSV